MACLRALQLDARQLRRALEKRLQRDADAGRDGAADVVALAGDGVEHRRRAEVDDDERRAVQLDGGDGVDDAVGADVARAVVEDADAGPHARVDDQGRHLEVAAADVLEDRRQRRDDAAQDGLVDVRRAQALGLEEAEQQDGVLVDEVLDVGGDAPAGAYLLAVEDADGYRRIADVKGQEHVPLSRASLRLPAPRPHPWSLMALLIIVDGISASQLDSGGFQSLRLSRLIRLQAEATALPAAGVVFRFRKEPIFL